jgi:hypothetical protein
MMKHNGGLSLEYREAKNTLFQIGSIALSIAALVLVIININNTNTILTVMSIALVCKCLAK